MIERMNMKVITLVAIMHENKKNQYPLHPIGVNRLFEPP